ncbi:CrcB family protein [Mycobacterium sp. M1]|uniref:Fluoride-specific ion channel FluC n=1 Tax=Mycolicibacter acidiphilus TaxID=2835306 RepID=A0ABS5RIY8_9MYCO|nr:CrcB family protein [Mycolicibacter acidiphilus]MBS9533436.1 CrcB family protein [Mycolicibacter acidiphilus]
MPDSDVATGTDPFVRRRPRSRVWRERLPTVAAVSVGGGIGAAARYGVQLRWPAPAGTFPWSTLTINVTGCALMGLLMVAITELWVGHRLLRPLLGTGILGGYTTFSTFAGEVDTLTDTGHPILGLLYLVTTPIVALLATWTAAALARRLLIRRTP